MRIVFKGDVVRSTYITALSLALAAPGIAQAEAEADVTTGETIIVTGKVDGYTTIETTTGTKTATPIIDVPQSITVVTEAQLKDQAIRSMTDLVRLIPGVSSGQGEGHRDQITLRGNNTTADFFVDGLRDDVQYYRSFYNIERVEVHKGPNAMIFGRGGGGGLVNRVTKGAVIGETILGGTVSADTFSAAYVAADTNFELGSTAGLRLNAFYERLNNHRDAFKGDRYAVNPVIGAEIGENARVQFGYEYVRDDRVIDRGIPSAFAGALAAPAGPLRDPRFRDTFFGIRGINETDFEAHVGTFRGEAELGGGFTLTGQALYGDYDKIYTNVFAATAVTAANTVGIEAYADPTKRQNLILQANLEWRGDTGGIEHIILFGGEYTDQDTRNERINGFFSTPITTAGSRRTFVPLTDPVAIPTPTFVAGPGGNSNRAVASTLTQHSLYIQDQIALSPHFDIIAGVRYDRLENKIRNLFTNVLVARTDDLWSPRVGLVAKPSENSSVYLSYSKSYLPQSGDQFLTFDATNANLEPEQFDNYEIGAKWDINPGLSLTTAVYRLDRTNTRAAGPVAGTVVLTGEQRTSGFEIGLTGRITPKWQTAIGLAHTKARITETTSAAPAGRRVAQVPRTQISIWNRYDVTERLGLGLGLYRQSRQFTTIGNSTILPAYTRLDAALFFKLTEQIEAQLNVENLTDKRYFPVAHNDNNISTGAPINARFTLGVKF
jgi:catecholate siderophore receptor